MSKVADFIKDILTKNENETQNNEDAKEEEKVEEAKLDDHQNSHRKYQRANTNVGAMNKYILQFQYVDNTYRLIEEAFLQIAKTPTQKSLSDKMKRKCEIKHIRTILNYLGYPEYTNDELKQIFGKDINSDETVTFKRILVGSGLCYFLKMIQNKKQELQSQSQHLPKQPSESQSQSQQQQQIPPQQNMTIYEQRFAKISKGFEIVKNMFDTIDVDGSGEITQSEFRQAFIDVCKDSEIVDARMKELDYNHDQQITFREFLFGIASWVGFDDPEQDKPKDDNNEELEDSEEI
jgi:hypothetical protein